MRRFILAALAALTLSAVGGCRVFCDDYPSHHYRHATPAIIVPAAPPPAVPPY
jgi:hypothetical protein